MSNLKFPENTLVLIATGEEAKTFRINGGSLSSQANWTPGDLADQGPSGKSAPDMSDKELNEATFSKIMAERLYSMSHKGEYDNLILVVDPDTLGEMRPLLHSEVKDSIIVEIDKTLINSPIKDIEKILNNAA